jgi:hypothetical protein
MSLLRFKGEAAAAAALHGPRRGRESESAVGGTSGSSKKRRRERRDDAERTTGAQDGAQAPADAAAVLQPEGAAAAQPAAAGRRRGAGRLSANFTTVDGVDGSRFASEVAPGDVIVVEHPESGLEEARVVALVLSDSVLSIKKPFSSSFAAPCAFDVLPRPRDAAAEAAAERARAAVALADRNAAFGVYVGSAALSREEQLDQRAKKKGDRYC